MTPSRADLWQAFGRIGILSFGGPAAQIGVMHRELVETRGWLTDRAFSDALAFCMLLPGPEAMQLATYCGWKLRGVGGGLLAGLLFVLPGAAVIAALALIYAAYGEAPDLAAALVGIQAAVIVIVLQALIRLAGRALQGAEAHITAVLAFLALFLLHLPFPFVVLAAGLWGWMRAGAGDAPVPAWPRTRVLPTVALWGGLWAAPVVLLWIAGGGLLLQLALFFGLLALVTFGGAYAVLAYMAQAVVGTYGWLTPDQMVDALGLAETTPGPLILVTQFVGMLAGHGAGGVGLALAAGLLTLWMTFVPCFLWIFAGAPFVEALTARPRPRAALSMISAAVVGVMLHLSLWFSFHVLFQDVARVQIWWTQIDLPDLLRPDGLAFVALALAALAQFGLRWSPLALVPAMGLVTALTGRLVAGV